MLLIEFMPSKTSKKLIAQKKQQAKELNKAIKKAVNKRLKKITNDELLTRSLSASNIENIAKNIAIQIIPELEDVSVVSAKKKTNKKVSKLKTKPSVMSFALTPYKKSPCKQCPAKSGGLCACAIKAEKKKTG